MRFEDEDYVKLYTRDTAESIARGWEARALLWEIMRKVDKAGILDLGRQGVGALAGIVRMPEDVVKRVFPLLLDDGTVERVGTTIVLVNFVDAQAARSSDRLRKAQERARARDVARQPADALEAPAPPVDDSCEPPPEMSHAVTRGHAASHDVTSRARVGASREVLAERGERARDGLASVDQPPTVVPPDNPKRRGKAKPKETTLPLDWKVSAELIAWARNTSAVAFAEAVVLEQAERFCDHALANAVTHADWNAAFRFWMRRTREYHPEWPRALPLPPGGPPDASRPPEAVEAHLRQLELAGGPVGDWRETMSNVARPDSLPTVPETGARR